MRKIKDIGKRTALAGIGAALSLIFVTLAYFVKNLSLSFYVLSSIGVMLPLAYKYYREGILTVVVVTLIGFFIANIGIVPFVAACGFYVVFTVFWHNKKLNRWIGYAIKTAYSILLFFIFYKVTALISVDLTKLSFLNDWTDAAIYIAFNAVFSICFIAYDLLLEYGYIYLCRLLDKILKNRG